MEIPPPNPPEVNNPPYDESVIERLCDIEMVGLFGSSNGRNCERHQCCGQHIRLGDLVRLKRTVVSVSRNGQASDEDAIAVVRIEDGVETCTVGFIPRVQMNAPKVVRSINKLAFLAEIYDVSENRYIRGVAKRNCGMAGLNLVENIPLNE
jgi:hypothetical protein